MAELTELDWKCVHTFAKNDMNINATSKILYMHYNTLVYHLDKVWKVTGLNPRRFEDLVKLTQIERLKAMLVVTCEVNAPPGLALAVKENLAMLLERYGDTKVVSVEVKEDREAAK